ncbi:unnamed protein product [Sphenostylis stenocarpa]|uniref:Transmembrane protein n=1 Tax=Sphenostylis stenocarpa TaxID=92480 RepID=A0AA86T842_9FABA|nr:unnamed protein product [Sphenostylis stenocarpa]
MLSKAVLLSSRPFSFNRVSLASTSCAPFSVRVSTSITSSPVAGDTIPALVVSEQQTTDIPPTSQSVFVAAPPIEVAQNIWFRPTPELGLLSHLFVLSMAFGAFFSVAVVSIPTLIAFGRLGASVKKLSKVVSEESTSDDVKSMFGGRHKIGGVPMGTKDKSTVRSKSFRKNPNTANVE